MGGKRGARSFNITSLPYKVKVYVNSQVLIPASLVRALKITEATYAKITIKHGDNEIVLDRVKLLRTRFTDSRQFTIPKEIRKKYNITPGTEIEVLKIEPLE